MTRWSLSRLAALAARLHREAGSPPCPSLYFLTDPVRTPDPVAAAARLPRGACVVYRHFGAATKHETALALRRVCAKRGLALLIAADRGLAARVRANGVHWPERLLARRRAARGDLMTAAAHDRQALARAQAAGAVAVFLSPVFDSRSASAGQPLTALRAARLARSVKTPVIALGGVSARTARRLIGKGFAGVAAVEALAAPTAQS